MIHYHKGETKGGNEGGGGGRDGGGGETASQRRWMRWRGGTCRRGYLGERTSGAHALLASPLPSLCVLGSTSRMRGSYTPLLR